LLSRLLILFNKSLLLPRHDVINIEEYDTLEYADPRPYNASPCVVLFFALSKDL